MRSILDQKSRKASATGVVLSVSVVILLIAFLTIAFLQGWFSPAQKSVANNQVNQNNNPVNTNPNNGNIAKVGVTVYDISGTNLNTKVALPIYCQNNEGVMVADGTTSSTSAETSVTTTIGETLKCYAFNSTYQVKQAFTIAVNSEYQSLRIDAFKMPTSVKLQFYNNNQQTGQNLSGLGSDSAKATFDRIRITNNNSNTILPIGGFYLSLPQQSNVSDIVVPATATGSYSVKIARSTVSTNVQTRRDNWDVVYMVSDASGNNVYLQGNDYIETPAVDVKANGVGVGSELITSDVFVKGFFRQTKGTGIGNGVETDASSASVINNADLAGDSFYALA